MVVKRGKAKKRKTGIWTKKVVKPLAGIMKEKQKTMKAREKIHRKTMKDKEKIRIQSLKARERIHRKAVKARKKKVEKNVDRLLVGACFLVCLAAAFKEAKEEEKRQKKA